MYFKRVIFLILAIIATCHAIVIPLQADSEVSYRIGVFVVKVLLPVLFFYLAFKKEKHKE